MEGTAGRRGERGGKLPLQHDAFPVGPGIRRRDRAEQNLGVGVEGMGKELVGSGLLDQVPEVHHSHPVGHVAHHRHVVGDEEIAETALLLKIQQQADDLGADGDVQRGDRLVADDQLRLGQEGAGKPDALALAARELMRIAVEVLRQKAHLIQQLQDQIHVLLPVAAFLDGKRLHQNVAHVHPSVQGTVGVLKDHLHPRPQRKKLA